MLGSAAAGALAHRDGITQKIRGSVERMASGIKNSLMPEPVPDSRSVTRRIIQTGLMDVEETTIPVGPFSNEGGSIAEFGDGILFVEPTGPIGYASFGGEVHYLDGKAPINVVEAADWMNRTGQAFPMQFFRTTDTLITKDESGSQTLYVSYSRFDGDCVSLVVSKIGIAMGANGPELDKAGWKEVYVAKPCIPLPPKVVSFSGHEAGGRMIEIAPGQMLLSVGHFAFDGVHLTPAMPQDPTNDLGKVLQIDLATGKASIYAKGLRNPQGLMQDSQGRIWETEHGPQGGDEVNILKAGGDYGWPATTFGMLYGAPRKDWPGQVQQGRHDKRFELPVFFFMPSVGVSNIIEVRSSRFPLWEGDVIVGSMKAGTLFRLRLEGEKVLSAEPIAIGERIRDLITLSDGRIALLTDFGGIRILDGSPGSSEGETRIADNFTGFAIISATRDADPARGQVLNYDEHGRRLFVNYCSTCHSLSAEQKPGPNLRNVLKRDIASVSGYAYSPALQGAKGRWSHDRLVDFVENPQQTVPGTTMPDTPLNYYDIVAVADYLATQK